MSGLYPTRYRTRMNIATGDLEYVWQQRSGPLWSVRQVIGIIQGVGSMGVNVIVYLN